MPYTLGGTALVWLFTRNITKTLAVLMVDFSCALKLAMPIAVLSAMRESNARHIACPSRAGASSKPLPKRIRSCSIRRAR